MPCNSAARTRMSEGLSSLGIDVQPTPDGIVIEGGSLRGGTVDSHGDHRIAMAFAIAGLIADKETEIKNAECVDVSFPGFFERLTEVTIV